MAFHRTEQSDQRQLPAMSGASLDQVLTETLRARRFAVTKPLKGAGQAKIFCVREVEGSGDVFVAKIVSLTGLDAKGRASALQEVSMLRGLEPHPNLIAFRESFLEDSVGVLIIVMSYAEDGDLRHMVTNSSAIQRRLPEPVVVWWLRQMLSGLKHLHSQDVVHRDLKSSNVFLCEGRRCIRIGDFGISRVLESTAFASSCVGTPAYMSPELMRNERYDYHVDMWAMGCIGFELCTLKLPFEARSLLDLVYQVVEAEPDWSLWKGFSEDLRGIVKRLLSKDAHSRPTAGELTANPVFICEVPADDMWDQLPATASSLSEEAKVPQLQLLSQDTSACSADTAANPSGSEGGTWTSTPRLPWDSSMSASGSRTSAAGSQTPLVLESFTTTSGSHYAEDSFARKFKEARDAHYHYSCDEFQEFLKTHHDDMLAELKSSSSLRSDSLAGAVQGSRVHESVL